MSLSCTLRPILFLDAASAVNVATLLQREWVCDLSQFLVCVCLKMG